MRLVLWDIDGTLLRGGGVAALAFAAAFTATTGVPWAARRIDAAGRTDLWIAPTLFTQHGVPFDDPAGFFARYAEEFRSRRSSLGEVGHALPGAVDLLAELAGRPEVVQTVVTGNVRAVAHGKLAAFGLDPFLDLTSGAYGDDHVDRAELVRLARSRAEAVHGPCGDRDVVVVGDTLLDVAGARDAGVVAIGVATGPATVAELAAAGADAVLPDLADVERAVAVIAPRTGSGTGDSVV